MNKEKLISVIVPVYKVEDYFEGCVRSIMKQTYQNLEIILVDDGSPDGCPQICDRLAAEDNRIVVIHQKNSGVAEARNNGLRRSSGEYIAFVDSDDTLEPKMYEILVNSLEKDEADIVVCGFIREYPDKKVEFHYGNKSFSRDEALELLVRDNMAGGCGPWNKVFKREVIEGIFFPKVRYGEDLLLMYRVYMKANKVVSVPEYLYHYMQREVSSSHSFLGVDDDYIVQAVYTRAKDLETTKYKELALAQFDGVCNACMHNCIKIYHKYHEKTDIFDSTFKVGTECFDRIEEKFPMSFKRKTIYRLFYRHTGFFLGCSRVFPFIR